MKTFEIIHEIEQYGQESGFLANVIRTHHRNPARKLKGLLELLRAGHTARTAQFEIDVLVIDGKRFGWEYLESPVLVDRHAKYAQSV